MNTKNKYYTIFVFILFFITGLIFWTNVHDDNDAIACTSNVRIHSGDKVLESSFNFNLSSGKGFINMNGVIINERQDKIKIKLKKSFTYYRTNNDFTLKQESDGILDIDQNQTELLSKFLPAFYIKKTPLYAHVKIENLRPGIWFFSSARTPYFICINY